MILRSEILVIAALLFLSYVDIVVRISKILKTSNSKFVLDKLMLFLLISKVEETK